MTRRWFDYTWECLVFYLKVSAEASENWGRKKSKMSLGFAVRDYGRLKDKLVKRAAAAAKRRRKNVDAEG